MTEAQTVGRPEKSLRRRCGVTYGTDVETPRGFTKTRTKAAAGPGRFRLRIMATSDLHGHILPHDYAADRPAPSVGLARTANLITAARAEEPNCLLVDNGDFLEGTPLGELASLNGNLGAGDIHPVVAAMNAIGYDAAAVGNHEFSFGVPFLERALADAAFPTLCANALRRKGPRPTDDQLFHPATLLLTRRLHNTMGEAADVRIGLIGLLPPQVTTWEKGNLQGHIVTRDILEAATDWTAHLRAAGADLILALCHSGIGDSLHVPDMENAAIPLARLPGIDALIAGHVHMAFPGSGIPATAEIDPIRGSLCGKPAVMAGYRGSHLGIIDLDLATDGHRWTLRDFNCEARAISAHRAPQAATAPVAIDPRVEQAVAPGHAATLAFIRRPIGLSDRPMHSYFARLADSAALDLIHQAQLDWLSRVVSGGDHAHLPRLSAASPFKSGDRAGPDNFTDIPAGQIVLRHITDLYTFPNSIRALVITGQMLSDWLERSAAQFRTLEPGTCDQPLINPQAPAYNFDVISGVSYQIDPTVPPRFDQVGRLLDPHAHRLRDLRHNGTPVAPGDLFTIATNDFRAAGGGGFPGLGEARLLAAPSCLTRDILRRYIENRTLLHPRNPHQWGIAPLPPETGGWFDTGPGARTHTDEMAALGITPIGTTDDGFLRCRWVTQTRAEDRPPPLQCPTQAAI